uniref:Transmembrane protein 236 n=2 Tax=Denticeps clupeoides TaxID=299321 RepID=A0AAY4A8V1_9TELE
MQRFAAIVAQVKSAARPPGDALTAYWLIVASSIAYLTSVALLVWLPLKYMVFMKKKALVGRKKWRPIALAYVILSTLPCFGFLIASSEVQINNSMRYDTFTELPVSLVLFSLICIDIVERIRHCRLTGQANGLDHDSDIPTTVLTHVEPVTPVHTAATSPTSTTPAPAGGQEREQNGARGPRQVTESNGVVPGLSGNQEQRQGPFTVTGINPRSSTSPAATATFHLPTYIATPPYSGPLRFLLASDARAEVFVDSFLFWMDTVEMVRSAGHTSVYYSGWVFPIYIFSFLSALRLVVAPHSSLLSPLGVALQDLPFLLVRVSLIAIFGFVTPLLYVMKNLLVCLAYIYFNFMTKLRIFNTERLF